jgi:hypothetical protein
MRRISSNVNCCVLNRYMAILNSIRFNDRNLAAIDPHRDFMALLILPASFSPFPLYTESVISPKMLDSTVGDLSGKSDRNLSNRGSPASIFSTAGCAMVARCSGPKKTSLRLHKPPHPPRRSGVWWRKMALTSSRFFGDRKGSRALLAHIPPYRRRGVGVSCVVSGGAHFPSCVPTPHASTSNNSDK